MQADKHTRKFRVSAGKPSEAKLQKKWVFERDLLMLKRDLHFSGARVFVIWQ